VSITPQLFRREHARAKAARWGVSEDRFAAALAVSVAKAFGDRSPDAREIDRCLAMLHVEDLALACACADGHEPAWDHFVRTHRPVLYRSADALAPGGAARELADSLYAELFGLTERDGERQSLFRYFHGRSSLATWLRAVLAQRFVDRVRTTRRLEPLPEEDDAASPGFATAPADLDRSRYLSVMCAALGAALERLADRERLRISLYYLQQLTLAETGRILGEHEATVSRQVARTRKAIRQDVERHLREEAGLSEAEIGRCFESVAADAGPLDLARLLGSAPGVQDERIQSFKVRGRAP
jgi:RNA polymerase sigma-70 factor (ECF subfamily)